MVFGIYSGKSAPQLDSDGHHYDANITEPYNHGPDQPAYISDPTHPAYDPAIDPNLQLRTVRTAAASIAESHRSEARRDERHKAAKKRRDRQAGGSTILSKLGRGKSILRREPSKKHSGGLVDLVASEFGPMPTGQTGAMGSGGEGVGVAFDSAQQANTPFAPTVEAEMEAEREAEREQSHMSIAEYEADEDEYERKGQSADTSAPAAATSLRKGKKSAPPKRRNVYLNMPLLPQDVDRKGEPTARYPRNKVRTSKYTAVTFLPRFLFEQFRRIANVYFLGLVVLQVFPTFGATVPQIAMLPLVSILTITAIKDSIEDYRRHVLDNQVNNSAVTRLGNWRNVNLPRESRTWFQRALGLGVSRDKVTKGVRKLRDREDAIGMRAVGSSAGGKRGGGGGAGLDEQGLYDGGQEIVRQQTHGSVSSTHALETIMSESDRGGTLNLSRPSLARDTSSKTLLDSVTGSTPSLAQGADRSGGLAEDTVIDYTRNVPCTSRWERTLWKKLEVGDIVLLREDDQVPADIVVLNSSDPDGNAYIETKNLDGETNLKVRKSVKATMGIQSEEDIEHSRFVIDSEPPHANLYSYNGLLKYSAPKRRTGQTGTTSFDLEDKIAPEGSSAAAADAAQSRRVEPVTINELLLRGCAMRNTDWVIGIVVFTGEDTKIMLNSGDTPSKRSKIEKETNFNVLMNFFILLAMCLTCSIIGGLRLADSASSRAYYEMGSTDSSSAILNGLIIFGSCLVVFQNIVPISLYISIEIVKTIQAFFIFQDIDMYYAPLDYPCVPKTWNISDDLGQIEYIFSDKTGTLTQNVMEFKKCSIDGVSYGEGITEAMIGALKRDGKDTSEAEAQASKLVDAKNRMVQTMIRSFKNRYFREEQLTLISPAMADELAAGSAGGQQRKNIIAFFRALALCHTALTDRPEADDPFTIEYKAQSPDEAALVSAARDVGCVFLNKNNQTIDIEVLGQPERYTPLKVLEFNSTRKRMSVIVREPDGRILMICKGADSIIYQRLKPDHPEELKKVTQKDLEDFANAGLRTLVIAYRYLEEREYVEWAAKHDEAAASLTDREDNIDAASELIEHSLTLLGATALEDKLQEGVPEAIELLHAAGIKLWILTGDKLQTAIEIGFSCNLLSSDMEIMIISADHEQGTRAQIEAACNKIAAAGRPVIIEGAKRSRATPARIKMENTSDVSGFAVVIDGETLRYALDPGLKPLFLALTTQCETVVCCRVSPAQKALTVKLVKDGKDAMTLAIGDGANDVAMIQEAHCGVGIAGLEGAQASMSADYAIGQFRFLTKLLLVHGHWSYVRIADMHKVFFYKNIIWTFTMFWFQIFCDFNATYLYDYSYVLLFNLIFTSLPVIILGALDQDVNPKAIMAYPQTYKRGIAGLEYTRGLFWSAVIDAIYQSGVCFFVPYVIWSQFPVVSAAGHDMGSIWLFGTTVGAAAVIAANLYAGMAVRYWTWIFWAIEAISILSYFVWALVYSALPLGVVYSDVAFWLYSTIVFWTTIFLCVILCLLPRFFAKAWRVAFHPTEADIVREAWVKGDLKQRLGLRPDGSAHYKGAKGRSDLEVADGLFAAAKRSTEERRRVESGDPDDTSETSADPLPVNDYERDYARRAKHDQATDEAWRRASGIGSQGRDSLINPAQLRTDAGSRTEMASRLSFYDPDQLPAAQSPGYAHSRPYSDRPASSKRSSYAEGGAVHDNFYSGQPGFDVPQINVQRASGQSFESGWRRNQQETQGQPQPYTAYSNGASRQPGSTTALVNDSTDSFNAQFDEAFGISSRSARAVGDPGRQTTPPAPLHLDQAKSTSSANDIETPTAAAPAVRRWHDRFTSPPASPSQADEQQTPRQPNFEGAELGLGQVANGGHGRDFSGLTEASFHTAGASDANQH